MKANVRRVFITDEQTAAGPPPPPPFALHPRRGRQEELPHQYVARDVHLHNRRVP